MKKEGDMSGRDGVELKRESKERKERTYECERGHKKWRSALFVSIVLDQIVEFEGIGLFIGRFILRVRTDKGVWRERMTPSVDDFLGDCGVERV